MFEAMVERLHGLRAEVTAAFEQIAVDGAAADMAELERVLVASSEVQRALQALEVATLAQTARQEERVTREGVEVSVRPLGHVDDHAAPSVALALGTSTAGAARRLGLAARLASRLPRVLRLVAQGSIDLSVADKVARVTDHLEVEACSEVEELMVGRLPRLDPNRVTSEVRRAAQRVAPEQAAEAIRRHRKDCDVDIAPGPMGTTIWWAMMPSEVSSAMWASITTLAARYKKEDPALAAGQARAQAFGDLVLRGVDVRAEVTLGMPVVGESSPIPEWARRPSSQDPQGNPVGDVATACAPTTIAGIDCWVSGIEVPKAGFIPPEAVANLLSNGDLRVGRALLEADTGVLRETCSDAYRPSQSMRHFVETRDVTCRMYGCSRPAIRCDLDHGQSWPRGTTGCTNLCGLCRRHHRTKQQRRWRFSMTRDGVCTWISPTGTSRETYPPAMGPPSGLDLGPPGRISASSSVSLTVPASSARPAAMPACPWSDITRVTDAAADPPPF